MRWNLLSVPWLPVSPKLPVPPHDYQPNFQTKFPLKLPPLALPLREAAAFPPHFPRTAATRYF
jgi:hypothetical protein